MDDLSLKIIDEIPGDPIEKEETEVADVVERGPKIIINHMMTGGPLRDQMKKMNTGPGRRENRESEVSKATLTVQPVAINNQKTK